VEKAAVLAVAAAPTTRAGRQAQTRSATCIRGTSTSFPCASFVTCRVPVPRRQESRFTFVFTGLDYSRRRIGT